MSSPHNQRKARQIPHPKKTPGVCLYRLRCPPQALKSRGTPVFVVFSPALKLRRASAETAAPIGRCAARPSARHAGSCRPASPSAPLIPMRRRTASPGVPRAAPQFFSPFASLAASPRGKEGEGRTAGGMEPGRKRRPPGLPMSMAKRLAFSRLRKISSGGKVMLLSSRPPPPRPARSAILDASTRSLLRGRPH